VLNHGFRLSRSTVAAGAAVDRSAGTTILYPTAYDRKGETTNNLPYECTAQGRLHRLAASIAVQIA